MKILNTSILIFFLLSLELISKINSNDSILNKTLIETQTENTTETIAATDSLENQLDSLEYIGVPEIIDTINTDFGVLVSGGVKIANIFNYSENIENTVGIGVFDFGIIFNKTWYLGASVNNLSFAKIESNLIDPTYNSKPLLALEYYGIELGANVLDFENTKIHFNCLVASGLIEYRPQSSLKAENNETDNETNVDYGRDDFIIIEPSISISYNLNDWSRFMFGINYRVPIGVEYNFNQELYDTSKLKGISAFIKLQFGDLWI